MKTSYLLSSSFWKHVWAGARTQIPFAHLSVRPGLHQHGTGPRRRQLTVTKLDYLETACTQAVPRRRESLKILGSAVSLERQPWEEIYGKTFRKPSGPLQNSEMLRLWIDTIMLWREETRMSSFDILPNSTMNVMFRLYPHENNWR